MQCINHTQFVKSNRFLLCFYQEMFTVPSSQSYSYRYLHMLEQCPQYTVCFPGHLLFQYAGVPPHSYPDFKCSWQCRRPEVEQANSVATNIPRLVTTRPSILALCSIKCIQSTKGGVRQANLICSSQVNAAMSQYKRENFPFPLDMSHTRKSVHTKHFWTNFYVFLSTSTKYVMTDAVSIMPQFYF